MKVFHVEAGMNLYGGARQVLYLLEGLSGRGVDNVLACPDGSAIADAAAAHVNTLHALAMGGDTDLGLIGRLRRLIEAERPDIVHLHSRRGADTLGALAARLARPRPQVVLSRRVDNPEPRLWVGIKYRLYDRIVTISEAIRRVLIAEGLPPERVRCVHSAVGEQARAVRCDRDRFRREFGLTEQQRVAAVVAQLIERKGHRYLIEALPPVLADHPELQLLLFGKGPLEAELRRSIETAGLAERVRLVGFHAELPRLFPCFEVVVHPALIEGLGVALLEGAAAGVPLIASDAGGMPEICRDGENGLLVPPGDPAALGAALNRLLSDPARAREMGARGRDIVAAEFSTEAMVEGNLSVYRGLLGSAEAVA